MALLAPPTLPARFKAHALMTPWPDKVKFKVSILIDRPTLLQEFLAVIENVEDGVADLFFDAEGSNHGWNGTLSTLQVSLASVSGVTYILDIISLTAPESPCDLFTETSKRKGLSLKAILENPNIPKVWFDVRQDSAALFGQRDIKMQGCIDLQLMELGYSILSETHNSRGTGPQFLLSLFKCIGLYAFSGLGGDELQDWERNKKNVDLMYGEDMHKQWGKRPLAKLLIDYATGDTLYMAHLYHEYLQRLQTDEQLAHLVISEGNLRVTNSFIEGFETSKGRSPQSIVDYANTL